MCLIKNDVLIGYLLEDIEIIDEELVVGKQDLEFWYFGWNYISGLGRMHMIELIHLYLLPDFRGSFIIVEEAVESCPFLNFTPPLVKSGQRC